GRYRGAGREHDHAGSGPERVGRTSHRLDGEAAAPFGRIGQRVAGEELQVGVPLVDPEHRLVDANARQTVLIAHQAQIARVEPNVADRPGPAEVVGGALDRLDAPGRQAPGV